MKIEKVKKILENKKVAIAFSGGADSTLMTFLAKDVCKDVMAITINNNIMPKGFIEHTQNFCKELGIKQEIIFEDFYKHENIISNKTNRCFLCRKEMYKHIIKTANQNGFKIIVDGTNISDLVADRPGILINYENNIQSPFVDAHLTSKEIHDYLDEHNIPYSRSSTCLATRVPFNNKFTPEKYERISKSEEFIYCNTNCKIVKVREKYPKCIVEVDNIAELCKDNNIKSINSQLKSNGYEEVLLKLEEIQDNDEIVIDYSQNQFEYQLPYEINMEESRIDSKNIKITEKGLVTGINLNSYNEAITEFMNILPKIRRKI